MEVYYQKPDDFQSAIHVAGCYCRCEGKLLLLKRSLHKPQPGTWGVPAGKLDIEETPKEAVIREVFEEVGLSLDPSTVDYIATIWVAIPDIKYCYYQFFTEFTSFPKIKLHLEEHTEFKWVTPGEAKEMPLIVAGHEALTIYEKYLELSRS